MSMKNWEKKVLARPGAPERIDEVEDELRLATGLTALREQAGLSQRELADRLGVSQPRVAAEGCSHRACPQRHYRRPRPVRRGRGRPTRSLGPKGQAEDRVERRTANPSSEAVTNAAKGRTRTA